MKNKKIEIFTQITKKYFNDSDICKDNIDKNKEILDLFSLDKEFDNDLYHQESEFQEEEIKLKHISNKNDTNLNKGHRIRVKRKFLYAQDISCLLDEDFLEMILFFIKPMVDVKPLSKKMIQNFKNLNNVFSASEKDLKKFIGNPESLLFLFKLIKESNIRCFKNQIIKGKNIINNWSSTIEYLKKSLQILEYEEMKVLYLNSKYCLINDEFVGTGTIDEMTIYIRTILKRCIELNTKFIIIAHNHPSGHIEPSRMDIELTKILKESLNQIEIDLIDHFIVGKGNNEVFSFRSNHLI